MVTIQGSTEPETRKQKLTLSVDSEVIEKAKKLGLNMSEITERTLRTFTFEPQEGENEAVYQKYKELFDVIVPLLQKYKVGVIIGDETVFDDDDNPIGDDTFRLFWDGVIQSDLQERPLKLHAIDVSSLHPPNKILTNLIQVMADSAERNKQRLTELELARRIVEAIAATSASPQGKTSRKVGAKSDEEQV